jgi:hypothetical protein
MNYSIYHLKFDYYCYFIKLGIIVHNLQTYLPILKSNEAYLAEGKIK